MMLVASLDQKMFASAVGGPAMGRFRQRLAETITFSVSYDQWLARSDSISAIQSVSVSMIYDASFGNDTPPTVSGQIILRGREVLFQLTGGFDGSKYEITVAVQTTGGEVKYDFFHVTIGRPAVALAPSSIDIPTLYALIDAWASSRPVWDGVSAMPVSTGQWFINNGKLEQAQ